MHGIVKYCYGYKVTKTILELSLLLCVLQSLILFYILLLLLLITSIHLRVAFRMPIIILILGYLWLTTTVARSARFLLMSWKRCILVSLGKLTLRFKNKVYNASVIFDLPIIQFFSQEKCYPFAVTSLFRKEDRTREHVSCPHSTAKIKVKISPLSFAFNTTFLSFDSIRITVLDPPLVPS